MHLQRNDATIRWEDSEMEVNELLGRFEKVRIIYVKSVYLTLGLYLKQLYQLSLYLFFLSLQLDRELSIIKRPIKEFTI